MSLQTYSGFEGYDRFDKLMVKPKVKGYHRHPALQTTTMQYATSKTIYRFNHLNLPMLNSGRRPSWRTPFVKPENIIKPNCGSEGDTGETKCRTKCRVYSIYVIWYIGLYK